MLGNAQMVEAHLNDQPYPLRRGDERRVELVIDLQTVQALRGRESRPVTAADASYGRLVEQVRSGADRRLQTLAAGGLLPLPPEDLIPLQIELARGADPELAHRAAESLRATEPRVTCAFLAGAASPQALGWFAAEVRHPLIVETILRRRDVPRRLLAELAPRLPPDLQEALLVRQDAIVEEPAILDALAANPQLSAYSQRRIAEYREHLVRREPQPAASVPGTPADEDPLLDEVVQAALEVARQQPGQGEVDERTGLNEGQIRSMPVAARLKLARGAMRGLRAILVRDPNQQVALAVMHSPALSDQEVEQIASSRVVLEEVLVEIGRRREWAGKYQIVAALVRNPKTPTALALRLVPKLAVRDLRDLGRDRNVPNAVRSMALRLYRIKQQ